MIRRPAAAAAFAFAFACLPSAAVAQTARAPDRAIRRDIPLTNMIRRAFAEGTRDSTGRPGRNYWQLWMDYSIDARLDAEASTLSGRETITLHNGSDSSLSSIQMRLDQNIFRGDVPRGASVPAENHEGFVITKLAVNGQAADLNAPAFGRGGRGGRGAQPLTQPAVLGIHTTSARISLPTPIAPKADATIDVEWHYKLAGGPGQGHRMTYRWGDTLYQVAQWYPRVAVYDDLRGWDLDPYLGPSEFYNNFGHFDVRLDVPAGWIVGATGVLKNPDQVLTPAARERLAHVLESDSTRTIVGPNETGPGRRPLPETGSSGISSPTRSTTSRGPRRRTSSGRRRARRSRRAVRSPSTSTICRATRRRTPTPARFSATRSSSTPSSGSPIRFRSTPWSTGRTTGWSTRCS